MKVLKTIVATAVVVFAMTSVAMAGVEQLTKAQDAQAGDKTRAQHRITLTDKQAAQLIDHQTRSRVREAQRTEAHARRVQREHAQAQQGVHEAEARHAERVHTSAQNEQGDHSDFAGQSGSHHQETSRQTHETSQTHLSTGGHDSGHESGHGGGHGGD